MDIKNSIRNILNKRNIRLSLKMFTVCISISLFLTVIIGVFTHYYVMKEFDKEIEKYEKSQIDKTANSIQMRFKEFEDIGEYYASHPYIIQFLPLGKNEVICDYFTIKKLMDILSSVIDSSNYINEIFVYYGESEIVLSHKGIFDATHFYDTEWKKYYNEIKDNLKTVDLRSLQYNQNSDNVLTFFTRINNMMV